jgi:hypothetical protein
MRFYVPVRFKEDVRAWIDSRYFPGNRSRWFPFYRMSDGSEAIMANIELDDALMFALTFEHEKMDKE